MIPISRRLKAIAALVDQDVIADIGCDHGYVCIEALLNHRCRKAYACDAAKGPLDNAQKNARLYGVENQMICRLQNGLHSLPDDTRQIIMAGMGGRLMISILEQDPVPANVRSLLLSPHKDADILRFWLIEHGYEIEMEQWIQDGLYYPVIKAISKEQASSLTAQEALFGRNPVQDQTYSSMLSFMKEKWAKIALQIPLDKQTTMKMKIRLANAALAQTESNTTETELPACSD